jgi:pectate lyase
LVLACCGCAGSGPDSASDPGQEPSPGPPQGLEGHGAVTSGGAGGDVYRVTTLADGGAGSLRQGVRETRSVPRRIVFDVAGTITLGSNLVVNQPNLTIDGSTAPPPGITLQQGNSNVQVIVAGTRDIVITHLRYRGTWVPGSTASDVHNFVIDGDSGPDRVAQRIVLDHVTFRNTADSGPDIWGEARDITLSWCLLFDSNQPTAITYSNGSQVRQRISVHHNVYARNNERNPQVRWNTRDLDFVNNVIYDWARYVSNSGTGMRVRADSTAARVHANVVNNAFVAGANRVSWGLVYGSQPGPDSEDGGPSGTPAQGTLVTGTRMGNLWVAGNLLPSQNRDHYSTISSPNPVPESARVTTWTVEQLKTRMIPHVGMMHRDSEEEALLAEIAARLPGP